MHVKVKRSLARHNVILGAALLKLPVMCRSVFALQMRCTDHDLLGDPAAECISFSFSFHVSQNALSCKQSGKHRYDNTKLV